MGSAIKEKSFKTHEPIYQTFKKIRDHENVHY